MPKPVHFHPLHPYPANPDCDGDNVSHGPMDPDADGFLNALELYVGAGPLDACPNDPADDAWPLDTSNGATVTVTGDLLTFAGHIGATPGEPNWWQRLDLNGDGVITVTADVLMYAGRIGESCPSV